MHPALYTLDSLRITRDFDDTAEARQVRAEIDAEYAQWKRTRHTHGTMWSNPLVRGGASIANLRATVIAWERAEWGGEATTTRQVTMASGAVVTFHKQSKSEPWIGHDQSGREYTLTVA